MKRGDIGRQRSGVRRQASGAGRQNSMIKIQVFVFFILFVGLCFIVSAEDSSDGPYGDLEVIGKMNDGINNFINPGTGKINTDALNFDKSKAQERIDSMNLWLNENVGWLRFVFRMTPQISLLFLLNFIGILWGLVYLFLRFPTYIDFYNKSSSYLIGFVVFLIFFFLNLPYYFARFGVYFIEFVNIPIVGFVILIVFIMTIPAVSGLIIKIFAKKKWINLGGKNKQAEKKMNENFDHLEFRRKQIDAYVEGVTGEKEKKKE